MLLWTTNSCLFFLSVHQQLSNCSLEPSNWYLLPFVSHKKMSQLSKAYLLFSFNNSTFITRTLSSPDLTYQPLDLTHSLSSHRSALPLCELLFHSPSLTIATSSLTLISLASSLSSHHSFLWLTAQCMSASVRRRNIGSSAPTSLDDVSILRLLSDLD